MAAVVAAAASNSGASSIISSSAVDTARSVAVGTVMSVAVAVNSSSSSVVVAGEEVVTISKNTCSDRATKQPSLRARVVRAGVVLRVSAAGAPKRRGSDSETGVRVLKRSACQQHCGGGVGAGVGVRAAVIVIE